MSTASCFLCILMAALSGLEVAEPGGPLETIPRLTSICTQDTMLLCVHVQHEYALLVSNTSTSRNLARPQNLQVLIYLHC
jgi:hypothetical protein